MARRKSIDRRSAMQLGERLSEAITRSTSVLPREKLEPLLLDVTAALERANGLKR